MRNCINIAPKNFSLKENLLFCFFILFFISADLNAQNSVADSASVKKDSLVNNAANPNKDNSLQNNLTNTIKGRFPISEISLNTKERFIANTLIVTNPKKETIKFYVELVYPESWKLISNLNRLFTVEPGDSVIIPIRVSPTLGAREGINISIQALLVDESEMLLSDASFTVKRKRNIRWNIESEQGDKIYFPVRETVVPFQINVNNEGNEKIDLLLSKKKLGTRISIMEEDSLERNAPYNELILDPMTDTSLYYIASIDEQMQNNRRIDVENYQPLSFNDELKNTVFFHSQLANGTQGQMTSGSRRLDFIRLPNEKKLNQYGTSVIPLVVDANVYNILGAQPVMNLNLSGTTFLKNNAMLTYQSQMFLNSFNYQTGALNNAYYRIAYNAKRGEIQIGNISGGLSLIPISGKGISGSYFLTPNLRAGAFYVRNAFKSDQYESQAMGGYLRYQLKNIGSASVVYGHTINEKSNRTMDNAGFTSSVKILRNQQIGFGYMVTKIDNPATPTGSLTGSSTSASYSASYLHKKMQTSLRGTFNSENYGGNGLPSRNLYHRSSFNVKRKWNLILQNSTNNYDVRSVDSLGQPVVYTNKVYYNQLYFNKNLENGRIMPNIFYNITNLNSLVIRYRGAGIDYSYFSPGGITRLGTSLRGGYNKLPDYPDMKQYFTLQYSLSIQHKTLSFNSRYYYGPQYVSSIRTLNNSLRYPQSLYLSLQQQWALKNKHFVLQTSANYSYLNQSNRHSIGFYPELYYFTRNNWRFKISAGYNISTSKPDQSLQAYQGEYQPSDDVNERSTSQNFYMNVGVRKEFGIPIPRKWSNQQFGDINIEVFLDANGNRKKDKNEVTLPNVVIKVGIDEVMTNEDGKARFLNVPAGKYKIRVWSLSRLDGWYALTDDSLITSASQTLFVPFVKGVKLSGSVTVQKDRYTGVAQNVDLSRIVITASDSSGKSFQAITDKDGNYVLYLPPGKFMLNMDEGYIGSSFIVLKNNAEISLEDGLESLNYNFYIIEKKRRLNIKKFTKEEEKKK